MKNENDFLSILRHMKGKWTLLLLGILGLAALLYGSIGGAAEPAEEGLEDYRAALTQEVTALCETVAGVGEVTVLLTLETGESTHWASDERGYVTAGGEGLLIEKSPPRVGGVAVVCTGGGDPAVREVLTELLSTALGIGRHRVRVTAKK